jgi:hypothetical protein
MVGVDPELGVSALRFSLAGGSAALLVVAGGLVLAQWRARALRSLGRSVIVVVLSAAVVTSLAWAFLDYSRGRDRDADRRALEVRAEQLNGIALAPGSALSCLDAMTGESVEAACEKALFATPATIAAAGSYVATQLGLLSDMNGYMQGGGPDIDNALLPLRRSLEADRFGFLANVLAVRDACTDQSCKALELLRDPSHVRANLRDATFDRYLERYKPAWTQPAETPLAEARRPEASETAQLGPSGQRKVLVNIDFPTAASIPPISIMNPEPGGHPAAAAAPAASAASDQTVRHGRKQQATNASPGPQSVPSSPEAQADPVWLPAAAAVPVAAPTPISAAAASPAVPQTASAPASAGAAPANVAAGAGTPFQLNPFAVHQ